MPICGYVVVPQVGAGQALAERLAALPGCDVVRARNRDLLLLVTDTATAAEDEALRERLEELDGVHALFLTFGEIDPETSQADPVREGRRRNRRRLPVRDTPEPRGSPASGCDP